MERKIKNISIHPDMAKLPFDKFVEFMKKVKKYDMKNAEADYVKIGGKIAKGSDK